MILQEEQGNISPFTINLIVVVAYENQLSN